MLTGERLIIMIEEELELCLKEYEESAARGQGFEEDEHTRISGTAWRPEKKHLEELQRLIAVHQMAITLKAVKQSKSNLSIPKVR